MIILTLVEVFWEIAESAAHLYPISAVWVFTWFLQAEDGAYVIFLEAVDQSVFLYDPRRWTLCGQDILRDPVTV